MDQERDCRILDEVVGETRLLVEACANAMKQCM
jgi:hypothetical protein